MILSYLSFIELIKMELLNKLIRDIIKKNKWQYIIIKLYML
uniref:Uncharacterized protein n=1 Tax=viral metagenome TaxID=1070528 RepID=A0A6C0LT31_9ZZZZ